MSRRDDRPPEAEVRIQGKVPDDPESRRQLMEGVRDALGRDTEIRQDRTPPWSDDYDPEDDLRPPPPGEPVHVTRIQLRFWELVALMLKGILAFLVAGVVLVGGAFTVWALIDLLAWGVPSDWLEGGP